MNVIVNFGLKSLAFLAVAGIFVFSQVDFSDARNVRAGARANVHAGASVSRSVNRAANVNVNRNVNVRAPAYRPTNVNIDVDRRYPVARGVAVGTAAAVTATAIGSMVYSLPTGCHHEKVNGVWYYRCGDAWYQETYSGSQQGYVAVSPPR